MSREGAAEAMGCADRALASQQTGEPIDYKTEIKKYFAVGKTDVAKGVQGAKIFFDESEIRKIKVGPPVSLRGSCALLTNIVHDHSRRSGEVQVSEHPWLRARKLHELTVATLHRPAADRVQAEGDLPALPRANQAQLLHLPRRGRAFSLVDEWLPRNAH